MESIKSGIVASHRGICCSISYVLWLEQCEREGGCIEFRRLSWGLGEGQALKCYCAYFVKDSMAVHFNFPGMFKDSLLFNIPQHRVIARLFRMPTNRISPAIHMPIVHRVKTILPILRCLVHINWPLMLKKPPSCRIYASYKSVITIFFPTQFCKAGT